MGVAVLEPGQIPLRLGRRAQFPAGIEEQLLPAPVRAGGRGVAQDKVGAQIGPAVLAERVPGLDDGVL